MYFFTVVSSNYVIGKLEKYFKILENVFDLLNRKFFLLCFSKDKLISTWSPFRPLLECSFPTLGSLFLILLVSFNQFLNGDLPWPTCGWKFTLVSLPLHTLFFSFTTLPKTPLLYPLEVIYIMAASPDSEPPATGMIIPFLIPEFSMVMCL